MTLELPPLNINAKEEKPLELHLNLMADPERVYYLMSYSTLI